MTLISFLNRSSPIAQINNKKFKMSKRSKIIINQHSKNIKLQVFTRVISWRKWITSNDSLIVEIIS